jgi:hypothetical protein
VVDELDNPGVEPADRSDRVRGEDGRPSTSARGARGQTIPAWPFLPPAHRLPIVGVREPARDCTASSGRFGDGRMGTRRIWTISAADGEILPDLYVESLVRPRGRWWATAPHGFALIAAASRRRWDSPPRSSAVTTPSSGQLSTGSSGVPPMLRKLSGTESVLQHAFGELTADGGDGAPAVPAWCQVLVARQLSGRRGIFRSRICQLACSYAATPSPDTCRSA